MPPLPVTKPFSAPNFLALQGPSMTYRDQDQRYAQFNRFEDAARVFFNRDQRSPRPERSERSARPPEHQDMQANVIPSSIPISIPIRPREDEIYRFH